MSKKHAFLSPSSASRWLKCAASATLSEPVKDKQTIYAATGTAAHWLAEQLFTGVDIDALLGTKADNGIDIDDEMIAYVKKYVDTVKDYAQGHQVLVEQRLPLTTVTGEVGEDAYGTADALVFKSDREMQVHDLKYGKSLRIEAIDNDQLKIYALAAYDSYKYLHDIDTVRMVIHQPRLDAVTDDVLAIEELEEYRKQIKPKAQLALFLRGSNPLTIDRSAYAPDKKACWYCPANSTCPALTHDVLSAITGWGSPITATTVADGAKGHHKIYDPDLPEYFKLLPLIRRWADVIEERAYNVLSSGQDLKGYKLVHGRKPQRRWYNRQAAAQAMRDMRLRSEDIYNLTIITPAKAEYLLRDKPKQWAKLREHIIQGSGRVEIAPIDDPRPALGKDQDYLDLKDI